MWHDVLLALRGIGGDIINSNDAANSFTNRVIPSTVLHPGEQEILARVQTLHRHYLFLETFAAGSSAASDPSSSSVYMTAIATVVSQVLAELRGRLLQLETEIVTGCGGGRMPLSVLLTGPLDPYPQLLDSLRYFVDAYCIKSAGSLCGMKLLDAASTAVFHCGVPALRELYLRLWQSVRNVFYRQTCSIAVQGSRIDPFNEYFITDEMFVDISMVPACIGQVLADKLHFIARALRTVKRSKQSDVHLPPNCLARFLDRLRLLEAEQTSGLQEFNRMVDKLHVTVARALWRIVTLECRLLEHLNLFKQYYFLGDGAFFDTFLGERETKSAAVLTSQSINRLFRVACLKTVSADDDVLDRFQVKPFSNDGSTVDKFALVYKHFGSKCFGVQFQLNYRLDAEEQESIEWIIGRADMKEYNAIFCVLLSLRMAQLRLQSTWTIRCRDMDVHKWSKMCAARHRMLVFLGAIIRYLQDDVIDLHFAELEQMVQQLVQDTDDQTRSLTLATHALDAHRRLLLAPVWTKSFLGMPAMVQMLSTVVDSCLEFTTAVQKYADANGNTGEDAVMTIVQEFDRCSTFFFRAVSTIAQTRRSYRLNTTSGKDVESTVKNVLGKMQISDSGNKVFASDLAKENGALGSEWLEQLLIKLDFNQFYRLG